MAGLVPAIHALLDGTQKDMDGRDKPGHDVLMGQSDPNPWTPKSSSLAPGRRG